MACRSCDSEYVSGGSSSSSSSSSSGSPCGACKYLRRKCVADCVFAPYFCCEQQGSATFAAIHKVFGASNLSKLLLHLPLPHRSQAVLTIAYEAHARIHDPVYGCLSHLFSLQQQVAYLQTQVMQAKAQLAQTMIESGAGNMEIQWTGNFNNISTGIPSLYPNYYQTQIMNTELLCPETSAANKDEALFINFEESTYNRSPDAQFQQSATKSTPPSSEADVGELQDLALRMMRN